MACNKGIMGRVLTAQARPPPRLGGAVLSIGGRVIQQRYINPEASHRAPRKTSHNATFRGAR